MVCVNLSHTFLLLNLSPPKGHLITNSQSVRELDIEHVMDVLLLRFHHAQTYGPHDYMVIVAGENDWSNLTFVIESEAKSKINKEKPEETIKFCTFDYANEEFIKACYGSMRVRFDLNADEQVRIKESRKGEF